MTDPVTDPVTAAAGHRLVLVDGPAGSGKTTLAASLGGPVLHLDELYAGWPGMAAGLVQGRSVVADVLAGREGRYRRWDWMRSRWDVWVTVTTGDRLVVEGCGAGSLSRSGFLIWVEAARETRLTRGLARDGERFHDRWLRWQTQEDAHFAADRTRERADLALRTDG